jgi:peptidoglycan/LPS O-acetylase OafA/YrhL
MTNEGQMTESVEPSARASAERSSQPGRFDTIQLLRFLAAFMVVLVHATFYTHERLAPDFPLYDEGASGVRLFFVISGFVMIVSSSRLVEATNGWRIFAVKRICRIVPIYWAILTLKLAIMLATPAMVLHAELDWAYILKSYFFVPAHNVDGVIAPFLGVGWTLNFEMFFYGLFALALFLRIKPLFALTPALIVLAALSLVRAPSWPVSLYFYSDPIVLDFLAGMFIALATRPLSTMPQPLAIGLALIGLVWLFAPLGISAGGTPTGQLINSIGRTVASALVVMGAIGMERRFGRHVPGFVLLLGAASYSLYLIHPIVAPVAPQLMGKLGLQWPLLAIAGSIVSATIAAIIAYRCVEEPVTAIVTRLARSLDLIPGGPDGLDKPLASPRPERRTSEPA